jgi:hypothetical protein
MNFGTKGCMYNCGDSCTGECMIPTDDGMNKEIKKGNLNYDQSGRAYPDNPHIKENWDCIWEKDGKHYKLVGDNEHKEWEEVRPSNETLYSEIEHLIIRWTIDGTKTAGSLTRDIMKLIKSYE